MPESPYNFTALPVFPTFPASPERTCSAKPASQVLYFLLTFST
jgi:hypothetical protein